MKSVGLLRRHPTEDDLARLYHELAALGAPAVGRAQSWPYEPSSPEELVSLAAEMLRYDARLLSILLQLVLEHWSVWNPLALRRHLARMRWPQALLVVLEFARDATSDRELRWFTEYVAAGHRRVEPAERFFFDSDRPGSRMAARKLGRNLAPYARWGFVGTERPVADAFRKTSVGRYDAATRRAILTDLVQRDEPFTLAEYLDAIDHAVSRQQALADLRQCRTVAVHGHGRGARWLPRATRPRTRAQARRP